MLEVSLLLLRPHPELDVEVVVTAESLRRAWLYFKSPVSHLWPLAQPCPPQPQPPKAERPQHRQPQLPTASLGLRSGILLGERPAGAPPPVLPPLTHVCTVPEVCGDPGMGAGLGEKVILSLRLPATNKARPLALTFADCFYSASSFSYF